MSDTLTAEEQRLLNQMQADDAASEQEATPEPAQRQADAQPEPGADTQQPQQQPQQPTMVDKRALDEERTRRRELAQKLADVERKAAADQARVEERLRLLAEAAQAHVSQPPAAAAEESPPPDFNTDPAGFIQHGFKALQAQNQQLLQRLQQVETGANSLTQAQREQQALMELQKWGEAQEKEFAGNTPDYREAIAYLANARERMVRAMGVSDPAEISGAMSTDVQSLARMARERGQQFGRVLYDLAVAHGYQRGAQQAAPAASNGNGAAALPSADTAAERLVRGQEMATTLGATGGAPRGEPAAQHIAAMSEEEFARYYAQVQKKGGAALRNLFGE